MRRAFSIFKFKMIVIGCGLTLGRLPVRAQVSPPPSPEAKLPPLQFEVAAIKPHPRDASRNSGWQFTMDSFSTTNLTVKQMILYAYDLKIDSQLQDLPNWGHTDTWDIQARVGGETVEELRKLDRQQRVEENRLMVQKLLATRFGLKVHEERRELPIYDLVMAKSGSKLKPAKTSQKVSSWSSGDGKIEGADMALVTLAYALSTCDDVGRLVFNETGLSGKYDIEMKWTPQSKQETADSGPSIFTALQEQLGLKLVPAKGPVDVIVVDHVEQPTPN